MPCTSVQGIYANVAAAPSLAHMILMIGEPGNPDRQRGLIDAPVPRPAWVYALRRRRPATSKPAPTTTASAPRKVHCGCPVMGLPNRTLMPWRNQTAPVKINSTPPTIYSHFIHAHPDAGS